MTPMMEQWHALKERAKEALLLFRLGDFYEAFHEDAKVLAQAADLTLTARGGIPMAGIPYHASASYIDRLIAKGFRVAIAEQVEDPKETKGLVKRAIVRTVSPGTNPSPADQKANFIACITPAGGVALVDVTTPHLIAAEGSEILTRLQPSEVLLEKDLSLPFATTFTHTPILSLMEATHVLQRHFNVLSLDGLGFQDRSESIRASATLLSFLQNEQFPTSHIQSVRQHFNEETLFLDRTTQRHLELQETFLPTIDYTQTPMGARLLKLWMVEPLTSIPDIDERLDAVTELLEQKIDLSKIRDIERLTMRCVSGFSHPRDVVALKCSLQAISPLKQTLKADSSLLQRQELVDFFFLIDLLDRALLEEDASFKSGFNSQLDELKSISHACGDWLLAYQTRLRDETGIKSLKVNFTNAFGYFIEVSSTHKDKLPPHFRRKQTLVSTERFTSEELSSFEQRALSAGDRIAKLEKELFEQLLEAIRAQSKPLFSTAQSIAVIDTLYSFARIAHERSWTKPLVDSSTTLDIEEGRHPVLECRVAFQSNSCSLSEEQRLMVLTGPNMGGKSTYIRQVALITLLAHMGSFVPAKSAHIGIVDKIFTRIGANDDLSRGQSTFMVEMSETANILHQATKRSLVILDEIGRGTSTFDGISLAFAVAEHLLDTKAKTLFATHYFELTRLEPSAQGAFNAHVACQELQGDLIFLHRILKGPASKSFGIHVARLAGLPQTVIDRATSIQKQLEATKQRTIAHKAPTTTPEEEQLLLF